MNTHSSKLTQPLSPDSKLSVTPTCGHLHVCATYKVSQALRFKGPWHHLEVLNKFEQGAPFFFALALKIM